MPYEVRRLNKQPISLELKGSRKIVYFEDICLESSGVEAKGKSIEEAEEGLKRIVQETPIVVNNYHIYVYPIGNYHEAILAQEVGKER